MLSLVVRETKYKSMVTAWKGYQGNAFYVNTIRRNVFATKQIKGNAQNQLLSICVFYSGTFKILHLNIYLYSLFADIVMLLIMGFHEYSLGIVTTCSRMRLDKYRQNDTNQGLKYIFRYQNIR